jgi:hypothetical protein
MEFAAAIVLSKEEALDLAEAMHLAGQELRRLGNSELAHRLRAQIDLIEDRLTPGTDQ